MSAFTSTLSPASSSEWAPCMPNSDLWTLKSARDVSDLIAPNSDRPIPRRVVAVRTSRPAHLSHQLSVSVTASTSVFVPIPYRVGCPLSSTSTSAGPASSQAPQPPSIGLGHPSTSTRSLTSDSPASSQASQQTLARINSSTIKRRTKRFRARELHTIVEETVVQQQSSSRSGQWTRGRSYAAAAHVVKTPKKRTTRRVAPAPAPIPSSTPTPTPSPGSSRCALQPGSASMSSGNAPAPRFTSSGAPQAGPTQVQSPRVLLPATMAGSPWFQSLDGAAQSIAASSAEEESDSSEEWFFVEDRLMKLRVHAHFRIRLAARRLKMLF
ncbi:hypothetical protein B0H11DRAFT_512050 [Mycena galericulata]|nr:hypothetical protein B0H11DRAFT_512050 [Mycena galericulata]